MDPSAGAMTIGQLARAADVGVERIRFYACQGLLAQPPKRPGYRQYPRDAVLRVRFIRRGSGPTSECPILDLFDHEEASDADR